MVKKCEQFLNKKSAVIYTSYRMCMHIIYCGTYIVAAAKENWSAKWELLVYY